MLTLLDYFRPDNKIALVIVVFLWSIFGIWLLTLVRICYNVAGNNSIILMLNKLVPGLAARKNEIEYQRRQGHILEVTPTEILRGLLPKGISYKQPVVRHLESIYTAGFTDGRLDIQGLLAYTEHIIGRNNIALRSFLSIFLIVGLLGTLFGLADSIWALLTLLDKSKDAGADLIGLLQSLKGAFAPSISGVLTSVLGTVAFSIYQRHWFSPIMRNLSDTTINLWVPELFPTIGQAAVEAAQHSLDAAYKVTEAAKTISNDTAALAGTLREADADTAKYAAGMKRLSDHIHAGLTPMSSAISDLGSQLNDFSRAMDRWNNFEITLKNLYSKLEVCQNQVVENSGQIRTQIESQTASFSTITSDLKNTHQTIFDDVRKQMVSLKAPFEDAAIKMLDQCQMLTGFVQEANESQKKTAAALDEISNKLTAIHDAEENAANQATDLAEQIDRQEKAAINLDAKFEKLISVIEANSNTQLHLYNTIAGKLRPSSGKTQPNSKIATQQDTVRILNNKGQQMETVKLPNTPILPGQNKPIHGRPLGPSTTGIYKPYGGTTASTPEKPSFLSRFFKKG
jgi:hypothetical protein